MKLVIGLMLPILVFLMLESCARTVITLRSDMAVAAAGQARPEAVPSRELGWERAPNFEGLLGFDAGDYVRKHDAEGFLAYDTPQIQDTSKPRIIAIGDSNTYGWGVPPLHADRGLDLQPSRRAAGLIRGACELLPPAFHPLG